MTHYSEPKVLIIYTGGTIGMIEDPATGELRSFDFDHLYDHVPELQRLDIEKTSISFEHPIDSSEITTNHWEKIAKTIEENYESYDGFVVLHGSDTMAYTASALSFMFDGLKKPIILTGSQLPIGVIRTDGKENLITAIEIAAAKDAKGESIVQEVAIYFEYSLYRGNRSTKDSASLFEAFRSPNYKELAVAGVDIEYNNDGLYRSEQNELSVCYGLNDRVALIKIFPGIHLSMYDQCFDRSQVDGIVIETFGAGNAPSSAAFEEKCTEFIREGGNILNITQCSSGKVKHGLYETSSMFKRAGVLSGGDLTTEAAMTKMMYVLNGEIEDPTELLSQNIRGEVTF